METRAAYVVVGSFVLTVIAGLVIAVLWLAHAQFAEQRTRYDVYFASVVTGLVEGSPVRISGVQVGRVVGVTLDPQNPERVRVTVEVSSDAPIRSDSVASIEVQVVSGAAAVEISPGSREAPPIQIMDDQRYGVIWSRDSDIQQAVATIPDLLVKLTQLTDRLSNTVDDQNRASLATTLDNLSRLTSAVVARSDDVDHMLRDGAADAKDLHQVITSLNDTAKRLDDVSAQAGAAIHDFDGLVQENRAPLKAFTQNGLDELRQLVAQTHTLVTTMNRTVDSIERDPSRLIYGDRREGYRPQ